MPRRPPTPTLFPYTTLFRSHALEHAQPEPIDAECGAFQRLLEDVDLLVEVPARRHGVDGHETCQPVVHAPVADVAREDRKSTRLNSSHLVISYAVFCLKKKN